ncbi:MAG: hypothetical protein AB4060_08695 [Crocosphaera sp.]
MLLIPPTYLYTGKSVVNSELETSSNSKHMKYQKPYWSGLIGVIFGYGIIGAILVSFSFPLWTGIIWTIWALLSSLIGAIANTEDYKINYSSSRFLYELVTSCLFLYIIISIFKTILGILSPFIPKYIVIFWIIIYIRYYFLCLSFNHDPLGTCLLRLISISCTLWQIFLFKTVVGTWSLFGFWALITLGFLIGATINSISIDSVFQGRKYIDYSNNKFIFQLSTFLIFSLTSLGGLGLGALIAWLWKDH